MLRIETSSHRFRQLMEAPPVAHPTPRLTHSQLMSSPNPASLIARYREAMQAEGGHVHASRELSAVLIDLVYHLRPELFAD